MNAETERDLMARALRHLEARTTDRGEVDAALDVARYVDPARRAAERVAIFRRLPIVVAHVDEVATPGDFLRVDAAGYPVLVVRGRDGLVRAFANVCRHRAAEVVTAPKGNARAFSCPYHAWTYALDGALVGVPHGDGFPHHAGGRPGLVELPCWVRAGLVFVKASPGDVDLDAFLAPIAPDLVDLAPLRVHDQRTWRVDADWKIALDGFLEVYHFRVLHGRSAFPRYTDNTAVFDRRGPHIRYLTPKRTLAEAVAADPAARLGDHAIVLHYLFPATFVQTLEGHSWVHTLRASGDGTEVTSRMLVPREPDARERWDRNAAILYAVIEEDLAMTESVARGLRSGAVDRVWFGAYEHAAVWAERAIDDALSASP